MFTIGVDIGTTSICVVLFDTEKKESAETVYISNHSNCEMSESDLMEQNPQWVLEQVTDIIEKFMEIEKVESIGITGQMHGILYVDIMGFAVSNLYTWKDERAGRIYKDKESYSQYLTRKTGHCFYNGYGIATHFYNEKNNLIPPNAVALCTIGDYIALRLAGGKIPKMDSTMAASLGGFLVKQRDFDFKLLEKAHVNCSYLPQVVSSGTVLGYFKGCLVVCACGDNQASFLAAVQNKESAIGINVGTGSQVSAYYKDYIKTEHIDIRPFFNQGYLYVGASLNGGKVYEHLAKFIEEICFHFANRNVDPYPMMEALCQKETKGLLVNPDFYGTRGGERAGGKIQGIVKDNFHIEYLIKSFLFGMTEELLHLFQRMPKEICSSRNEIYASGNGLRKNRVLVEEVKEQFSMPVNFSKFLEEAAVGAAMCGMSAVTGNALFPFAAESRQQNG